MLQETSASPFLRLSVLCRCRFCFLRLASHLFSISQYAALCFNRPSMSENSPNEISTTIRKPVSLVVTVLNESEAITKLLDSILAQRRLPDEVVVVDGGSSDDTLAVLERYQGRLPLKIIVDVGANISRGRNVGIQSATYELIAVTDAGVRLDPQWLATIIAPLERPNPPEFVSGFFLPESVGVFEHALAMTTLPAPDEMGKGRFMPSSRSVAFPKSTWALVGGYPEWMTWSEDVLFDLALIHRGVTIEYVQEAIAWFRPRASLRSFARQYRNYAYGDGQGLLWTRRHLIRYGTYLGLLPFVLWLMGKNRGVGLLLLAIGAFGMFWTPLKRHWRSGKHRWSALPLIPLIRLTGDIAKMWGYPQALGEGRENRERTQLYLGRRTQDAETTKM
jgi:glycosyltransferase involved in cell wall biosynthesis